MYTREQIENSLQDKALFEKIFDSATALAIVAKAFPEHKEEVIKRVLQDKALFEKIFDSAAVLAIVAKAFPDYEAEIRCIYKIQQLGVNILINEAIASNNPNPLNALNNILQEKKLTLYNESDRKALSDLKSIINASNTDNIDQRVKSSLDNILRTISMVPVASLKDQCFSFFQASKSNATLLIPSKLPTELTEEMNQYYSNGVSQFLRFS